MQARHCEQSAFFLMPCNRSNLVLYYKLHHILKHFPRLNPSPVEWMVRVSCVVSIPLLFEAPGLIFVRSFVAGCTRFPSRCSSHPYPLLSLDSSNFRVRTMHYRRVLYARMSSQQESLNSSKALNGRISAPSPRISPQPGCSDSLHVIKWFGVVPALSARKGYCQCPMKKKSFYHHYLFALLSFWEVL